MRAPLVWFSVFCIGCIVRCTQAVIASGYAGDRRLDAVPLDDTWWSQFMGGPYRRGEWTPSMAAPGIYYGGQAFAQYDDTWYHIAQGAISTDGLTYYGFNMTHFVGTSAISGNVSAVILLQASNVAGTPPVLVDRTRNIIYGTQMISATTGSLYAVDLSTNTVAWRLAVNPPSPCTFQGGFSVSSWLDSSELIMGFSYQQIINSVTINTQKLMGVSLADHSTRLIGTVSGWNGNVPPVIAEDGTIVIIANRTVWAYAATGVLKWSTLVTTTPLYPLSVSSYGDGIVYATGGYREIYALRLTNGSLIFKRAWGSGTLSGPIIVGPGGLAIVPGGQASYFYAYSPDLKTLVWSTYNVNFGNYAGVNILSGVPPVLYVGSCPSLVALNATDGSLLWSYNHGQANFAQMVVTRDGDLIFSAGRYLYKLVDVTPTPTATASVTRSPSRSVSSTKSVSVSATPSRTSTVAVSISYSASESASAAVSMSASVSASETTSATQSVGPTNLPSSSSSLSLSMSASASAYASTTASVSPSASPLQSLVPSTTVSSSVVPSTSNSPFPSPSATGSASASISPPVCYDMNMQPLEPSNPSYQLLGHAVRSSADGQVLGVGAPGTNMHGMASGAVALFVSRQLAATENISLDCTNTHCQHDWVEVQQLTSEQYHQSGEAFGSSLAISADGSYIVVGAPGRIERGHGNVGQAYGFRRSGWRNGWHLVDVFAHPWEEAGAAFGASVAASANGNFIAIGAPGVSSPSMIGKVFVFIRQGDGGWASAVLTHPRLLPGDAFGSSLAMSLNGKWLAVGTPGSFFDSGAVIVHRWVADLSTYVVTSVLFPPFPSIGDAFGAAISYSASGRVLAIGAPGQWVNGRQGMGAAYLFINRAYSNSNAEADMACFKQLLPPPPCLAEMENDAHAPPWRFGSAVSASESDCIVGAPGGPGPAQGVQPPGAALLYHGVSTDAVVDSVASGDALNITWPTITRYTPPLQDAVLSFGSDVGMDGSGHLLVVGAPMPTINSSGAAFAMTVGGMGFDITAETLNDQHNLQHPIPRSSLPAVSPIAAISGAVAALTVLAASVYAVHLHRRGHSPLKAKAPKLSSRRHAAPHIVATTTEPVTREWSSRRGSGVVNPVYGTRIGV